MLDRVPIKVLNLATRSVPLLLEVASPTGRALTHFGSRNLSQHSCWLDFKCSTDAPMLQ